jgi:KamA family protein
MAPVRYLTDISKLTQIPEQDRMRLRAVANRYAFRVNDYYLSLIDWSDPDDPLRRLVIPTEDELLDWGRLDASNEASNTVLPGLQHKYRHTALLLVNEICAAYCRYCFRKRLFMDGNDEAHLDITKGVEHIRDHPEITNVLLTGGDPLILSARRLDSIFATLRSIPHVRIIRLGSKLPAFSPQRITENRELLNSLSRWSRPDRRIYLMAHFDHPRELTSAAIDCLDAVMRAGVIVVNQCPLIRGVNDDPDALAEMFRKLSFAGAPQYYVFQGRPTAGNLPFELPIVSAFQIFDQAMARLSGLAKRARFVLSHESGKVEVVGVNEHHIYMRYHRAKNTRDTGRFLVFHRDDSAYWMDDLEPADDTLAAFSDYAAEPAAAEFN